ncbi:hypothetical protein ACFV6F_14685 [Kitasatospora phosalacinea]|uniref:hypothetical protein n=1 Tax=Kitasatospora phosalacinea TaxID=2065 RepID=UPI00365F12C4
MIDWSALDDAYGPADAIPEMIDRAADGDRAAIDDLWHHLCHQGTITSASIAALPRLTDIAETRPSVDWALDLAGGIAAGLLQRHHGADEEVARQGPVLARLRATVAARLIPGLPEPTYLGLLRALLAFDGRPLWHTALDDFTDASYTLACPHCRASVTIAIGQYGCYSSLRDWDLGDIHQVPLQPNHPDDLTGAGQTLHELAERDGQTRLAWGFTYLFGRAECPNCGSLFNIAEEYEAENAPNPWDFGRPHVLDIP